MTRSSKHKKAAQAARKRRYAREYIFKRRYGITKAERDELLKKQGGVCAVCGSGDPANVLGWHLDHCHGSKKVRGVLCHRCNTALGVAKECPDRLRKLADYVEFHNNLNG